jgi:transposase-like protein
MNETVKPEWVDKLVDVVKTSKCRTEVLKKLGLTTNGSGNHRVVQRWIENLSIDTSHFNYRKVISDKLKYCNNFVRYKPEDFLIENWNGSISPVKKWARKNIEYKCLLCNNEGVHRNLPLKLQLDHENGNPKDNRKENLRWLCPNCHTQMETYGSKKLNLHRVKKSVLNPDWNSKDRPHRRKVERPSKEDLQKLIKDMPITHIGKMFGVSDNSVRKWAKRYKIIEVDE